MDQKGNTRASDSCPVCGHEGRLVKHLPSGFIIDRLNQYYCGGFPDSITVMDYDILRCRNCSLEYASPMIPGDDAFYSWLSARDDYYPSDRWEWPVVMEQVRTSALPDKSVLEVGSGSGLFLSRLCESVPNVTAIGLDPTENAIRECRKSGLEAYGETLEEYGENPDHTHRQFDFVCAFHCLEHVAEPGELLRAMIRLTHSKSRIFLSTPYSPMSFETNWHDPLNHPPHHLTRWNASAYKALASSVGWRVDLIMPDAGNVLGRTLTAIGLARWGPGRRTQSRLATAMGRPDKTVGELRRQLTRERVEGRVASDVVLARFQPIDQASGRDAHQ